MARVIDAARSPTGAAIAKSLDHSAWESLVVGSSLPIREVDAHLARSGEVIANRGASGIDGFISTALGVSSVKRRTVALTGDLGLLHDANGFLSDSDDDLVIVVVDNDGGGLFDGLPPAQHAPSYERLFVASQERELAQLARFHDLEYFETSAISELPALVDAGLDAGGVSLIRVPVSRRVDLEMRHQLDDVAREAVGLLKT
jgi:2-succinyl-5-enolpyruvyl-6-hydroxy-3-cyclohexene-1-carboxylate synthase